MYTEPGALAVAAISADPRDVALRRAFDPRVKAEGLSAVEAVRAMGYTAVEVKAAIESRPNTKGEPHE